jgi:hypothetical protein
VQCAVFAPPEVARGATVLVQVFAFLVGKAEEAARVAREFDDTASRRGFTTLLVAVRRGQHLVFRLSLPLLHIPEPVAELVWNGLTESVPFQVSVPEECRLGDVIGTVVVTIDEVPVGQIKFKLRVIPVAAQPQAGPLPVAADHRPNRFRKAFVSYSSKDRDKVELALGMLALADIDYFQDVRDLTPGQPWKEQLEGRIDECDLFLLFWSSHARESAEVRKEIIRAVGRLGPDGDPPPVIWPYIIEGPPYPEPPPELSRLHFGHYRHVRNRTTP